MMNKNNNFQNKKQKQKKIITTKTHCFIITKNENFC